MLLVQVLLDFFTHFPVVILADTPFLGLTDAADCGLMSAYSMSWLSCDHGDHK